MKINCLISQCHNHFCCIFIGNRLRNNSSGSNVSLLNRPLTTQPSTAAGNPSKPKLILSDSCIKKLSEIASREEKKYLRITVDGGGCSGFQYLFDLDDKVNEDDVIIGKNGSQVVIDSVSLDYCAGSTIDYHTELIKSGFRVVGNPKAEQGCSCGASFALKLD